MGSSSSKPARQLGRQAASAQNLRQGTPSRPQANLGDAGTAPPRTTPSHGYSASPDLGSTSGYSESKTQAVRQDGQDPQLLANLQKIGQVQIPRGKVHFQKSNTMLNILAARSSNAAKEEEANSSAQLSSGGVNNAGAIKNHLNVQTVMALLDERKECKTRREMEQLAITYGVDITVLDQLARFVNSPSVEAGAHLRQKSSVVVEDGDGDDLRERFDALWTEPVIEDVRQISERA